ncbi:PAS domain S-box protein [Algoriphagus lacus]|uniref:histidine kinase n=1 Tax=Algoriphagus lacus TaxID=2056311 RepID=A0A418PQV2_9BACT|nr:PAS domain-containing protein [Algoriphagus lacus]RIW14979.1 PAS domain S-box protein [Algoriphagus lacus]
MGTNPNSKENQLDEPGSKILEETKELLRKIEALANIGHWEVDLVTGKNTWSDQFYRILGLNPAITTGTTELGLSTIHPEDRERATASYQKSFETGSPYKVEKRIIRPSGEIRHVISEGIVELGPEGRPVRLFGVFKDITEEKLKEEALQQSINEIENLFHTTQDLILITDLDGKFKKVSQSSQQVLGYPANEMLGKSIFDFVYSADLEVTREFWEKIIKNEPVNEFKNRSSHPDGWLIHFSWSSVFDPRSQTVFLVGRDITPMVHTKEKLRSERQNLSIILNSSPYTIWTLDKDYNLITANQHFIDTMKEIAEWEPKPGENLVFETPLPQSFILEWKAWYDRAIGGESFSITRKVTLLKKGGYMEIAFKPIFEEGEIIAIACYSQDITQRKEEEIRTDELVKRLNLAQKIGKLGYWEFDIKTEKIYWSDEVFQIWGIDKSQFNPNFELFLSTIHPEDQGDFLIHHHNALAGIAPLNAVHRILLSSGEIKFVHEIGGLETDPVTGNTSFRGTVQDITQEKSIEKVLWDRNKFIEYALENLPMGIAVNKMSSGEATYINPAFGEIYGWPTEVLKDVDTFFDKIYPNKEYRGFITGQIIADIQSGDPERMIWKNIPITTQTGEERIITAKNIPLPEQDLMISTVIDETDRYWAEHSLRTSNERFHLATQAVSDAIWDWDIKKNNIFWGKGYHRLFGYPEEVENVSEDLWQTKIHPADLEETWLSIQEARNTKETHRWTGEYRFQKFDGTYAYVKENTVIIRDSEGKPIRMVGALQDITQEKEKELQILKKTRLIAATSQIIASLLETEDWQEILEPTLKIMGESVETDRAYLLKIQQNSSNQFFAKLIHEWTKAKGPVESHKSGNPEIPLEQHLAFLNEGSKHKPFSILTKDASDHTRQFLEEQNIKSILIVPIFQGDELFAHLGFEDYQSDRIWSEDELNFLQVIGTNLAFAIERKKNLDEIQNAFESRNSLLESIGDSFYALDKNYKVTYWNNVIEKLTGIKKEEILGKSIWDFVDVVNDQFTSAYEKALKENVAQYFETFDNWLKAWLEVTIYPANGGLSAIIKDITERRNTANQLAESNERFAIISEASNDAIWDWNLETEEHFWGEGFQKLFGINASKEGKSSKNWEKRVHPEDLESVKMILNKLLSSPDSSYFECDYRFQRQDGSFAYVTDKGSVIRDKEGKPIRLVGAIQDITQRKEYEESLKKLNEDLAKSNRELEISNKELEQFAYVASHDLQEPLRMISSFLGLIEKKYQDILDEKGLQYIHFAVDGAKRMREIILDLLEFSRLGNITESKKEIDLNDLLLEVTQLNKKSIKDKNAIIHIGNLPKVVAHSNSMIQLFQNLISNGLKYQPEGQKPEIWIEATELPTEWEFQVRDNGIGIEPEFKDKIFIIFQRLHQKEQFSGSGIGLAICKKIVEFHSGKIWVESIPGQGSTFFFTIKK